MEGMTCAVTKVFLFVVPFQPIQHVQQDDRMKTRVSVIVDLMEYSGQENDVLVIALMYLEWIGLKILEKLCRCRIVLVIQLVLEEVLLGDGSCHDLLACEEVRD